MIGRPVTSPVEAYAAGVRGWACAIPEGTVRVIGDSSGPNEQAMESQPALAVEQLSVREAYRVGAQFTSLATFWIKRSSASRLVNVCIGSSSRSHVSAKRPISRIQQSSSRKTSSTHSQADCRRMPPGCGITLCGMSTRRSRSGIQAMTRVTSRNVTRNHNAVR